MTRATASVVAVVLVASIVPPVSAAYLTYYLGYSFSGSPPQGPGPWMLAEFNDYDSSGLVRLTMTAIGLTNTESCGRMYFNFTPSLDPTSLRFHRIPASEVTVNGVSTAFNGLKADGDGWYDIEFDFAPPPGGFGARFTSGESVVYDISGSGITVASFDYESLPGGGAGVYHVASHIQGIDGGSGSDWIGDGGEIPEPESIMLLGLVLAGASGLGLVRRRRR